MYRNIQNSQTWVKQYKDYAVGAVIRLKEAVDNIKKSLANERRRIIETILAGNIDQTSASLIGSYDLPPPVYEAPPSDHQQQQVPTIPPNVIPHTPSNNSSSNMVDTTTSPSLLDVTTPPHPITPVMCNTAISPILANNTTNYNPNDNNTNAQVSQPYKSHNVNNPFQ